MIDYNEMGTRIRKSREQSGYTRLKVCENVHISEKHLYEIERGKQCGSIAVISDICEFLRISLDYVAYGKC